MPTLLQISQLGQPVLRTHADVVQDIQNPEIQKLIDDMIATCEDTNGVGIAAPQVYRPLRLFIVASKPSPRYPDAPNMEPVAIINPFFLFKSSEIQKDWEGCLSIPGMRGLVPRHTEIRAEFQDRTGKTHVQTFVGFLARVFQHEYDHLDGTVFLDRADPRDLVTEKEYQRMIREQAGK